MDERTVWKILNVVVFINMLYILIFILLKAFGVINTPRILELSPYILAIISLMIIFVQGASFINKLWHLPGAVFTLTKKVVHLDHKMGHVETRLDTVEKNQDLFKQEFKRIDTTLISLDIRVKHIEEIL